jgi:chemotaxis protein methyltransferase CheR
MPELTRTNIIASMTADAEGLGQERLLVECARLNLLGSWPMRGQSDVVFCRKLMINFDIPTRRRVLAAISPVLRSGGHFHVGHSESLLGSSKDFQYVQPAVCEKGMATC